MFSEKGATFSDGLFSIQTLGFLPEAEFSQSLLSIDISPWDNTLKPLYLVQIFIPKKCQEYKKLQYLKIRLA
jgi:hypothetical protein